MMDSDPPELDRVVPGLPGAPGRPAGMSLAEYALHSDGSGALLEAWILTW